MENASSIEIYRKVNDPLSFVQEQGAALVKSGMFGCNKMEQGSVIMLGCMTEGLSPFQFLAKYHVMGDGKISRRAESVHAEYRKRGGKVKWLKHSEKEAEAKFVFDGEEITLSYTIEDARTAGLIRNGSGWEKHPGDMLRARLVGKAVKMLCPEIYSGDFSEDTEAEVPKERPGLFSTPTKEPEPVPDDVAEAMGEEPTIVDAEVIPSKDPEKLTTDDLQEHSRTEDIATIKAMVEPDMLPKMLAFFRQKKKWITGEDLNELSTENIAYILERRQPLLKALETFQPEED